MKKITLGPISREDSNFLKGIAILLIVLHNYFKWIKPVTGQNEFGFSISNIIKSYIFVRANPFEIIQVFFNFLGHYGVQAFIFLSAYGLTLSYQKHKPKYIGFVLHRFDKLYPSFIFAALLYIIIKIIQDSGQLIGIDVLTNLGIQLSLFANFIPGKAFAVNGPWWFYSLIFQFYFLFPVFMWINRKLGISGLIGLTVIGYAFTILMYQQMEELNLNTLQFFTGHLPEFCFGILLASKKKIKIPAWTLILALLVFVGGNIYKWLWPYTFLSITLLFIVIIQWVLTYKHKIKGLATMITFIGYISMYLFACHGFLRLNFIILANNLDSVLTDLLVGLLYVGFSVGISYLMMQTEKTVRQWINAPEKKSFSYIRFVVICIIILVSFSFLFGREYMVEKVKNKETVIIYSQYFDFEQTKNRSSERYIDTVFYSGTQSYYMPQHESYSPAQKVKLDTIDLQGIAEIEMSSMIYASDSLSEIHIVLEIFDGPSNFRLLWRSKSISAKSEQFQIGKWFLCKFKFPFPKEFAQANYRLKTYLWNNSKGDFFIDNQTLLIKAYR